MLRVLHSVSQMNRGGIETLLMNIYRNIDRSKVQFDFLVSKPGTGEYDKEIKQLGGRVFKVRPRASGVFNSKKDLEEFFSKHRYSTIHVHRSSLSDIQVIKIATKNNVSNRIIHCHNTQGPKGLSHELMHRYNKLIIDKNCTDKFACSEAAAIWGFGEKATRYNEVHIFNNAINSSDFVFDVEARAKLRNEMNLNDKFVVGHVGRFVEQKNHKFIINIFSELIKTKPNAILLLIGEGNLKDEIKQQAVDQGIRESVVFLGSRSDVNILMQAMDAFLFPSLFEGLGMVAIEAQSSGIPVFASNTVPEEAAITELFHKLSLRQSPKEWAKKICLTSVNTSRFDRRNEIINKGFDIKKNTEWLTNYYLDSNGGRLS